jgi:hypothetical protein
MDRETAEHLLKKCHLASIELNAILLDKSPSLSDADFVELRGSVAHVLAYMFDYLIEPAITQYPDLNPYK